MAEPPRFSLAISPAARRFFALVFVAAWSVPLIGYVIEVRMVRPTSREGLFTYHGDRGPWRGSPTPAGGWTHPDGPTELVFAPGDSIVWETSNDVVAGTNISAEFNLVCAGVTIYSTDFHLYANERREGWGSFGLTVPLNAPAGDCGIRRSGNYTAADGRHEHRDFTVIPVRIAAPPAVPGARGPQFPIEGIGP